MKWHICKEIGCNRRKHVHDVDTLRCRTAARRTPPRVSRASVLRAHVVCKSRRTTFEIPLATAAMAAAAAAVLAQAAATATARALAAAFAGGSCGGSDRGDGGDGGGVRSLKREIRN